MKRKWFLASDDLTGALDTGVQFARHGFDVKVVPDPADFSAQMNSEADVFILCTMSRHLAPRQARERLYTVFAAAKAAGRFDGYFKKLDSTLRGNVGSELEGMAEALQPERLHLINAFPAAGRTTKDGCQYVHGVPLHETAFAHDPFHPIQSASIGQIIRGQSQVMERFPDMLQIHDAQTDEDIRRIVDALQRKGELYALAGCAGLAEAVAQTEHADLRPSGKNCRIQGRLLILCGSLNAISDEQIACAEAAGVRVQTLPDAFFGEDEAAAAEETKRIVHQWESGPLIVQTPRLAPGTAVKGDAGARTAAAMGRLFAALMREGCSEPVLVVGGDTLAAAMEAADCRIFTPLGEALPGTAVFQAECPGRCISLLSKAGGFGGPETLLKLTQLAGEAICF